MLRLLARFLSRSYNRMRLINDNVPKILVIYTGGTIGMTKNDSGVYAPTPNAFLHKIRTLPEFHDEFLAKKVCNGQVPDDVFVIPHPTPTFSAISYLIKEYNPLLDSSNMSVDDWIRIAKDIESFYNSYDGFVILHGTDTLVYTASALSFMLEGLTKPVIVTGSQIPIFEPRTDARDNFLASLVFAARFHIPEVCVCFAHQLLRGNRTVKSSSNLLDAFSSPNYHNLGKVGIHFKVHHQYILKAEKCEFKANTNLNPNVGSLPLFPTVTAKMLSAFFNLSNPPLQGLVLQTYGIGNMPMKNTELVDVIKDAVGRGIIIVNVTQCAQGTVLATYETGKDLEEMGIITGHDMTAEAALAKLSYVLGLDCSLEEKKQLMTMNLRGELTNHNNH